MLTDAREPAAAFLVEGLRWVPRLDRFEARRLGILADGRRLPPPAGAVDGILAARTLEGLWAGLTSDVRIAGADGPGAFGMDVDVVGTLCGRALALGCSWFASLHLDEGGGGWTWEATLFDEIGLCRMPAMRAPELGSALSTCLAEVADDPLRIAIYRVGRQVPDWLHGAVRNLDEGKAPFSVAKSDPRRDEVRRRTILVREGMAPDFVRAHAVGRYDGPRAALPRGYDDGSRYVAITLNGETLRAGPDTARRIAEDILAALGEREAAVPRDASSDDPELERLRVLGHKAKKGHLRVSPTHWGFVGLDAAVDPVDWDGGTTINGTPHLRVLRDGDPKGLDFDDAKFVAGCWNYVSRLLGRGGIGGGDA